ncbi:MAG TPA: HAD-IB family phosphatase, partial [Nitrososphaera sp.]|nr:HAD-IB family phosphatase [Nitrososphaera sp.]
MRTGNGQYAKSAKLAAFDMDGTLLQGRLVFELASRFDLEEKVRAIQASKLRGFEQSEAIALLFKGIPGTDVTSAIESIPLAKNCEKAVSELKERGYATGIISDSYTLAANYVAEKLGMDFVSANQLEVSGGKLTGNVTMPLGWEQIGCFCKISVCKRYHLEKAARERGVDMRDTVAIGDTRSDVC